MKKYLLFDFDGVIADSYWLSFEVAKKFCPRLSKKVHRRRFEGNINDWEVPGKPGGKGSMLNDDFFAEFGPRMISEVKLVPGAKEVISKLEKKYQLIIISSTITSPVSEFLVKYDLAKCFLQIMGNDVHHSKVEKIKMVFAKYHLGADDCVFITDTLGDMREAEKSGVGAIGVTWGFHSAATLLKGKPFRIVAKPSELAPAIADYFKALA